MNKEEAKKILEWLDNNSYFTNEKDLVVSPIGLEVFINSLVSDETVCPISFYAQFDSDKEAHDYINSLVTDDEPDILEFDAGDFSNDEEYNWWLDKNKAEITKRMIDKYCDETDHQIIYHNTGWTVLGMVKEWLDQQGGE